MPESRKQTGSIAAGAAPGGPGASGRTAGLYGPNRNTHLFDRFAVVIKYYKAVLATFLIVVSGWM